MATPTAYKTKLIQFLGRSTPIILQENNGPCPLLAICNILLLRNNLDLGPNAAEVSQEKLLSLVAERLLDSNSNMNNRDAGYAENQRQNIAGAIEVLPCLATGIDVNIKFERLNRLYDNIDGFEFTRECAIFDLLGIRLCHGWIVDPQDRATARAIGSKSYNALGDLVALETTGREHKELVRNFLDSSASQLTIYGLSCLQNGLKERELCAFFRNNHFNTMFKYEGQLYLLATGEGFINQPDVVWEKLNGVNGRNNLFMTSNFKEFKMESATCEGLDTNFDLQLATALQQQQYEQERPQRNNVQQQSIGGSRQITGPQVNGDTLFMTGDFKEFKMESDTNDTWDEHNAMASTADNLASNNSGTHAGLDTNSDLQLAKVLQEQEYEQEQPQRSNNVQQQSIGGSRPITGPQMSKGSAYSSNHRS